MKEEESENKIPMIYEYFRGYIVTKRGRKRSEKGRMLGNGVPQFVCTTVPSGPIVVRKL